jgi:PST family polysaccharide transporter
MAHVDTRDQPPPDTRFHATRGILLTQVLRLMVRVVTAACLARLISPAYYGVYGMAALVYGLAYVVQDFGLASVTLRKAAIGGDERTALFWLNAGTGALLAVIVAALGPAAAAFYGEPLLRQLLPALAVTFVINGLYAQLRAQLARERRFGELNRIEIAAFVLSSGVALLAARLGAGCWALATLPLTAEVVIAVGVWRAQAWRPGRWPAGFSPRTSLALGAAISGHEVLRYLQRSTDQFFIGRWFGPSPLGLYGRSAQLVLLPGQYLTDPLAAWVISSLGQSHDAPGAARAFWCRVVNGLAHLTLPLAVVLFCLPWEVLRIAFGSDWTPGAAMLRGISISLLAQPVLAAETWLLIATGHSRRLLAWSAVTLVLVIAACLVARPAGPAVLGGAISGVLLLAAFAGAVFVLRGLPAGPRDLAAAMARPLLISLLAVAAVLGALTLVPASGSLVRVILGTGITVGCWAAACATPGVRGELTEHFLRSRP